LFYEQERRPQRAFLRPLTPIGPQRILVPRHLVLAAREVAVDMFGDGRLMWPDLPAMVRDAAVDFRKSMTRHFEKVVEATVDEASLPYRANLEPHEVETVGVHGLKGEIDLLACDEVNARLWLLETKEHIDSASPYSITQRARRFLKPARDTWTRRSRRPGRSVHTRTRLQPSFVNGR